jgi:hypothetical protein
MSKVCIVGKGKTLLQKQLGEKIDSHDIVIRANHLPSKLAKDFTGNKTSIISTRCKIKLHSLLSNIPNDCNARDIWICSELRENYLETNSFNFRYITNQELDYISTFFPNFKKLSLHRNDKKRNFFMPDTGITTILLSMLRFPDCKISVCGFDLYEEGNKNIFNTQANSSLFLTPVFQQNILYKHLKKRGSVVELL